jgi:hypothetical protein
MLEVWTGDVEAAAANVVDGFVVDEERTVRVLDCGVRRENGIIGLDNGGGNARGWVDSEFELAFLAVVGGEALEEEGAEA